MKKSLLLFFATFYLFTMWMGELDNACDRETRVKEFNRLLASLQAVDPGGYTHSATIDTGCRCRQPRLKREWRRWSTEVETGSP